MRRWGKRCIGIILVLFLFSPSSPAKEKGKYRAEIRAFEEFVAKEMRADRIPGISIAFQKGDFLYAKGFGYSDLENGVRAKPETAYRLASITKPMTAVGILKLVEEGKIDLDAPVQEYVPYFPEKKWKITVRELLGHLGGISHYRNRWELHIKEHKDTREAIGIFANFPLVAEPGTEFHYSSYGYNLLGAVIEGASGRHYGDYMRRNVWAPLGMNDTRMDDPNEIIKNRVRGYRLIEGKLKNSEFIDISSRFAGGGTRSTVLDLLKFARGITSGKVISRKTFDLMSTSMATKKGLLTDYGMGLRVRPVNGHFVVSHSGSQAETRTLLVIFPKEDFAIAIGCNLEGTNLNPYAHRLFQLLFDEQWNIPAYTGDKFDSAIYRGLFDTFNYGASYFDKYGKPLTEDEQELAKAFSYLNRFLNKKALLSSYKETLKKIGEGRHPVAGEPLVKVGSYMAMRLAKRFGEKGLDRYHKMGALPFFADYIRMYRNSPNYPAKLRFSPELERRIICWEKDWGKAFTDYIRRLMITPYSDFDEVEKRMTQAFSHASIYPKFVDQFARVVRYFYLNGEENRALKVADIAIALYPRSAAPYVIKGNAYISLGDSKKAKRLYERARELGIEDKDYISPKRLIRYADDFASFGRLDQAIALIRVAIKLYPDEAVLYQQLARSYLAKAKKFYEKALKLDPNFEPAWEMLKKIKKIENE